MLLTISVGDNAQEIESLLSDEAGALGYPLELRTFCAVLRNPNGGIEGGIKASSYWEWIQIGALVVAPAWRNKGYGKRLLCAILSSFSWSENRQAGHCLDKTPAC